MLWRSSEGTPRATLFRRIHERWLTRALTTRIPYPRIPIRRVDDGGFNSIRSSTRSRARADLWWTLALERVDSGHLGPLDPPP